MAVWKQLILSVLLIAGAAAACIHYFPVASSEMLARVGIDRVPIGSTNVPTGAGEQPGEDSRGGFGGPAEVIAEPVEYATVNDRLSAIGTGQAIRSVTVTPSVSGRLTEILVAAGDHVAEGDVVARLDSQAEEILADRARLAVKNAEAKVERYRQLSQSRAVTAVDLDQAILELENARLELRDAELALSRRSINAPIDGVVGIVQVEAGDYITPETAIATIDDRSDLLINFWVPERFADDVSVGQPVEVTAIANPGTAIEGTISAVDNRIDEESRTLRVRARIDNERDRLRAGMSFSVTLHFPGDRYPAVDPLAIQWDAEGSYVWKVENGIASRLPVRIVQRNIDNVLVDAALTDADDVVTQGIHRVRDGREVQIADRRNAPAAPISATGS